MLYLVCNEKGHNDSNRRRKMLVSLWVIRYQPTSRRHLLSSPHTIFTLMKYFNWFIPLLTAFFFSLSLLLLLSLTAMFACWCVCSNCEVASHFNKWWSLRLTEIFSRQSLFGVILHNLQIHLWKHLLCHTKSYNCSFVFTQCNVQFCSSIFYSSWSAQILKLHTHKHSNSSGVANDANIRLGLKRES